MTKEEKPNSAINKIKKALLDYLSYRHNSHDEPFSCVKHPVSMISLSEWADGQIADESMEKNLLKHKIHIDGCESCTKAIRYYRQQKEKNAMAFPPL